MILADCMEERTISVSDYSDPTENDTAKDIQRIVQRPMQQVMVPGQHLVKVEMERTLYDSKLGTGTK